MNYRVNNPCHSKPCNRFDLRSRTLRAAGVAVALCAASGVQAATLTLAPVTFGIYESFGGFSHTTPDNLIRYDIGNPVEGITARHYFVYDLSTISEQITGASLRIFSPGTPQSPNSTDRYKVSAISTDIGTLIDPNTTGNATIFDDLNDGTVYGQTDLSASAITAGTTIDVNLGGALTDLNAQRGSRFAIGGAIDPLITSNVDGNFSAPYYFSGANNSTDPRPQLILETATAPVPLPAAWVLFLAGGSVLFRLGRKP